MKNIKESPVESVDRALQLLMMLQAGEILSVKLAAERLSIAPPTAHRLLRALKNRNFATQDPGRQSDTIH